LGKCHHIDGQIFITGFRQKMELLAFGGRLPAHALAGFDHTRGEMSGPRGQILVEGSFSQGRGELVTADYLEESPPGHENDVWPYKVENHEFYAVPVSTYALSGEKMPLDDQYAKEKGLSSSQWYDLLVAKLNEISGKDEPLAIRLSTSTSGTGDYSDALKKFLDYAVSNDAKFVKASDLVNMSRMGIHEIPMPQSSTEAKSSECLTCNGEKKLSINITGLNESESVNLDLIQKSSK
jgi:hypothetical protein